MTLANSKQLKRYKHGMIDTPTYNSWDMMIARCTRPSHEKYPKYGGRGIKICARWRYSFVAFLEDMGVRPEGTTLDRVDVNGDYEPGNCRWATPEQQANNRTNNRNITYNGKTQTLTQWAKEVGLTPKCLQWRLNRGWETVRAMTTPQRIFRIKPTGQRKQE